MLTIFCMLCYSVRDFRHLYYYNNCSSCLFCWQIFCILFLCCRSWTFMLV